MTEAQLQSRFTAWLRTKEALPLMGGSSCGAFELKMVNCARGCRDARENSVQVPEQGLGGGAGALARENPVQVPEQGLGAGQGAGTARRGGAAAAAATACRTRLTPSRISVGQREALRRVLGGAEGEASGGPLAYKISDGAIGYKPFDCFVMGHKANGAVAAVVVGWRCGGQLRAWAVGIGEWEATETGLGGLGLREGDAMAIGVAVGL